MPERKRLLVLGHHRTKNHDELEEALQDLIDATEEHYTSVLGCTNINEQNYLAMMHASLRISGAVRGLYIPHGGGPDNSPEAQAMYDAEAEEEARRPYPPQMTTKCCAPRASLRPGREVWRS